MVCIPFRLVVFEDLPLGVVADDPFVDETAEIELLRSELGHAVQATGFDSSGRRPRNTICDTDIVEYCCDYLRVLTTGITSGDTRSRQTLWQGTSSALNICLAGLGITGCMPMAVQ